MENIVLHVGMPKCGSSAIQTALSNNPEFKGAGGNYRYLALLGEYDVLNPSLLARWTKSQVSGYIVSDPVKQLLEKPDENWQRWARQLREQGNSDNTRLILSHESWGHTAQVFKNQAVLARLGVKADVIIYVRPQASWLNSAWWQWGAWKDQALMQWLMKALPLVQWGEIVRAWQKLPDVASVTVRLLPKDVVGDFYSLLGATHEAVADTRVNVSLPAELLRVFQRNRQLRTSEHDAAMDFVAARHLELGNGAPPWIIRKNMLDIILEKSHASNQALLELLAPDQQEIMRNDPAWWSKDYYQDKIVEPWQTQPPNAEKVDALLASALMGLKELNEKYRQLLAKCPGEP